jgi:hypothetical protein
MQSRAWALQKPHELQHGGTSLYIASPPPEEQILMPHAHRRHFSVEEAQGALRDVRPLLLELVAAKRKLDAEGYDVRTHQYFGGRGPNGRKHYPPELERLVAILRQFEDSGVLVKGIDQGLIDFPHLRATGEEVYLCYQADEERIRFWHTIPEGFAGRRPLEEL